MRCSECGTRNSSSSVYCEECGAKLATVSMKHRRASSGISDVVFVPKSNSGGWLKVMGIAFAFLFGLICVLFILMMVNNTNNESSTSAGYQQTTTPIDSYFSPTELSYLLLNDSKMLGNSDYVPNPTFEATLHNSGKIVARNIVLKINFYKSASATTPEDTQYVTAASYLAPGDSTHMKGVVTTNFNTSREFWWRAELYSAER